MASLFLCNHVSKVSGQGRTYIRLQSADVMCELASMRSVTLLFELQCGARCQSSFFFSGSGSLWILMLLYWTMLPGAFSKAVPMAGM